MEGTRYDWSCMYDDDGLPCTPLHLYGTQRRFLLGRECWDYYEQQHKEKSVPNYDPLSYIEDIYLSFKEDDTTLEEFDWE